MRLPTAHTNGDSTETVSAVQITHDFMETYGGAERVTAQIAQAFPDAPVTALLGRRAVAARMGVEDRFHSIMPGRERLFARYRPLAPLFPHIARRAVLPPADLLVSSSYAFAHHFRTANGAPQLCYCHSPLRFAWSMTSTYRERWSRGAVQGWAFDRMSAYMRKVDLGAAREVTRFATQSPYVARQIEEFYGVPAEVVGAPVDVQLFHPGDEPSSDYYLVCGRLIEPYKQFRIVVDAFSSLRSERLVVVGNGPAMQELQAIAPPNVEFRGHLADHELVGVMQRCKALIFPSRDDFGLMAVEAMACGRPVLAYGGGGALYTAQAGVTGEFFHEQTSAAVADAVRAFDPSRYDTAAIRSHAEQWDALKFGERMRALGRLVAYGR